MNDSVSASVGYDLASKGKRLLGYVIDMAVVFFLLFLKGLFGLRRRLGDMLAKTIVINSPPARCSETA